MMKTAKTPYHSVSIITLGPAGLGSTSRKASSHTSETIFTGDAVYVRSGGERWRKIDLAIITLQNLVRKASSQLGHCRDFGSDKLKGVPVAVFFANQGDEANGTTTKLWVDEVRGVLARSETATKSKDGSRHSVVEYTYEKVAAPQL